jgi:hypothetical protein
MKPAHRIKTARELQAMNFGPSPASLPCGFAGQILAVLTTCEHPVTASWIQEDFRGRTVREVREALAALVARGAVKRERHGYSIVAAGTA